MKKAISYLFLAGVLFASACSSKSENKESTESAPAEAPAQEAPAADDGHAEHADTTATPQ